MGSKNISEEDWPKGTLVSSTAIKAAVVMAEDSGYKSTIRWHIGHELEEDFMSWNNQELRNPDAAFIAAVPSIITKWRAQ